MTQTAVHRKLVRTAAGFTRKAIKYGQSGRLYAEDLAIIIQREDGQCFYCGIELNPMFGTFDHKTPFERGGANDYDNVVLCCLMDNRQKFTMTEAEYREWLGVERICPIDGTKFKPRAADYRRGYGYYCSRRCSGTVGGSASP